MVPVRKPHLLRPELKKLVANVRHRKVPSGVHITCGSRSKVEKFYLTNCPERGKIPITDEGSLCYSKVVKRRVEVVAVLAVLFLFQKALSITN